MSKLVIHTTYQNQHETDRNGHRLSIPGHGRGVPRDPDYADIVSFLRRGHSFISLLIQSHLHPLYHIPGRKEIDYEKERLIRPVDRLTLVHLVHFWSTRR